jgi:hypothetical protein
MITRFFVNISFLRKFPVQLGMFIVKDAIHSLFTEANQDHKQHDYGMEHWKGWNVCW